MNAPNRPPEPWKSYNAAFGNTGKVATVAGLGVGTAIFLLATMNVFKGQPIIACQSLGIVVIISGTVIGYLSYRTSGRTMDDWYLELDNDTELFALLKTKIAEHLRARKYQYTVPGELDAQSLRDSRTGEVYCVQYLIKNPSGPGYAVRLIIRTISRRRRQTDDSMELELLNVRNGNLVPVLRLAAELDRITDEAIAATPDRPGNDRP